MFENDSANDTNRHEKIVNLILSFAVVFCEVVASQHFSPLLVLAFKVR